jgi:nucleoside-diphosphate-sugar epimerase
MTGKVLVTGAAGHIGSDVCRILAEAGLEVCGVDRVYASEPVRVEPIDLLDPLPVYRLVEGCDAVVHLANHPRMRSGIPAQTLYAENVTLNANVFQAAVDVGVRRIVYASSVQVFGGTRTDEDAGAPSSLPYLPIDGDTPANPGNAYGLSKEAGEGQLRFLARMHGDLCAATLRFPLVLGGEMRRWIPLMRRYRRRGRFPVCPDEGFGYLDVEDAGSLILAILQKGEPGYHQMCPAAPDNMLGLSVPEAIAEYFPGVPLKMPADQMPGLIDTSAISEAFGWQPEHVGVFTGEE